MVWREKLAAFAIHFVLTAILAAIAAALIFLVWFPHPFQKMIGGTELFLLIVGCDLALGPLMSLVIYNSRKSRRELVVDYSLVGIVQVAALIYGVYVLAASRPVFVVFSHDRIELVTPLDIRPAELEVAKDPWRSLSWTGPRYVATRVAEADRQDVMFQAIEGNERHQRPKFFVPYDDARAEILTRAKPIEELTRRFPQAKPLIDAAIADAGRPVEKLRWLPGHYARGFWTVLVDAETGRPAAYADLDPY